MHLPSQSSIHLIEPVQRVTTRFSSYWPFLFLLFLLRGRILTHRFSGRPKIIKEYKLAFDYPIAEHLKLLNERRNQIVHEGKLADVEIEHVENSYGQVMFLLYVLGEAAIKNDLPLVDEVGFITDCREKEKAKID